MRFVHGTVSAFVQGDTGFRRTRYRAIVEPRLARLQLASDWRIFQTLSVPDILPAARPGLHIEARRRIGPEMARRARNGPIFSI
ncbi:contractile injection system protein, VgrG/Pvc8 family [Pseudomonas sp. BN417]|uniref:contractile injection system protein, VgrG/Pvc8 family n=1 Tax=Pseudomonas sp. BN417 TaxID=2567890 RepID=UPI0032AF35EA